VVVNGGVGDAGALRDVADAGAGEALLGEETERRIEDLLPGERSPACLARALRLRTGLLCRNQLPLLRRAQPNRRLSALA
jgi:hypothetical protein